MLDNNPHNISDTVWWYDGEKGISIVHEIRGANGEFIRTDQFVISRQALEAYLWRASSNDRLALPSRPAGKLKVDR